MESSFAENIRLIREAWDLSQTEFGTLFKVSRAVVMQWEARGTRPKPFATKLIESFTGLTLSRIEGDALSIEDIPPMPFEAQEIIDATKGKRPAFVAKSAKVAGPSEGVDVLNKRKPQVGNCYVVPVKAFGGFLEGYDDVYFLSTLEKTTFPDIVGECYSFEVEGFSMYKHKLIDGELYENGYKPGGHVITTPVDDFKHLVKGKDYVFVTTEGVIIKRFDKIADGLCHMVSINAEYNPVKPLKLKSIKKVFMVQKRYA